MKSPISPTAPPAELAELRACFSACLDTSSYGTLVCGRRGQVIAVNRRLCELFSLEREHVIGQPKADLLETLGHAFADPKAFARRVEAAQQQHAGQEPGDAQSLQTYLDEALPLARPGSPRISVTCATIHQGRDAVGQVWSFEDASEVSRDDALLQTLGEASATPFVMTRISDARILHANRELGQLLGCAPEELVGRTSYEFYARREDREAYIEELLTRGHVRNREVKMRRRDGSSFWCLMSMNRLDMGGEVVAIGGLYDITARKHAEERQRMAMRELRETQAMLVTSEKMAALGSLVAGIAHEINTPIGAMISTHDTLVRAFKRLRPTLEAMQDRQTHSLLGTIEQCNDVIQNGAQRVATIVRRLRSFARLDAAELQEVSVEEGLDDTLALLQHELKRRIEVVRDYGSVPTIPCYAGRLNQVFLNLLVNAHQAIPDKGTITVGTRVVDDRVSIRISDDGVGIAKQHLARLFDPGFTTKGVGVGTGLGLSICYQIIQDHKGEIRVESTPGKGSTFEVLVPMNLDPGSQTGA